MQHGRRQQDSQLPGPPSTSSSGSPYRPRGKKRSRPGQGVPSHTRPSSARLGRRQQQQHPPCRGSPRRGQRRRRPSNGSRRRHRVLAARPPHTTEPLEGSQRAANGMPLAIASPAPTQARLPASPGSRPSRACRPARSHTVGPPAGECASRRGPSGGERPAQHALLGPATPPARPPPAPMPFPACRPALSHTVGPPAGESASRRGPTGSEWPAQHAPLGPAAPPAPPPAPQPAGTAHTSRGR